MFGRGPSWLFEVIEGIGKMRLEVTAELFPEGSVIVAYARALDLASCGKTQNEAVHALMEALRLFLSVSQQRGTLDRILVDSGFVLQGDMWRVPTETEGWTPDDQVPPDDSTRRLACVEI